MAVSYPAELAGAVTLPDGTPVFIRPIRSDDAAALVDFHDHLSAETVYRRFFGVHPHLSPTEVERFTNVDYQDRLTIRASPARSGTRTASSRLRSRSSAGNAAVPARTGPRD